jgi:hypothetical protein
VVGKVEIALHLTECHEDAAVECETRNAVYAYDIAYRGNLSGHDGVSECHLGRCLAAGQVSLQVDSLELLLLLCSEKRSRAQTGSRGSCLAGGGVLLWGHEGPRWVLVGTFCTYLQASAAGWL